MADRRARELTPHFAPAPAEWIERVKPLGLLARRYHDHQVVGIERVPRTGPVLMAMNHSLATYDGLLLSLVLVEQAGRVPQALGDDLIFKTPRLRRIARKAGVVPASPDNGRELLRRGALVLVAPGGMREALRPGEERYGIKWERRKGFVRLALATGAPIQLAACPDADRLYHVYESKLTKAVYKTLKVPVPVVRGWGPTLIPRPVRLTHVLSEPLAPPALEPDRFEEQVDDWHAAIRARMAALMAEARSL